MKNFDSEGRLIGLRITLILLEKINPENQKVSIGTTAIGVSLNHLSYLWATNPNQVTCENLIEHLIGDGKPTRVEGAVYQYKKIEPFIKLGFLPAHPKFVQMIIESLRYSICDFMIGNFLGTISLCGTVCEMMVIFLFNVWNEEVSGKKLNDEGQKIFFKNKYSFEEQGQKTRISNLNRIGMIDDETKTYLDDVRKIRNEYLHYYSKVPDETSQDALIVFQKTIDCIEKDLGFEFKERQIFFYDHILEYMKKTYPKYDWYKSIHEKLTDQKFD